MRKQTNKLWTGLGLIISLILILYLILPRSQHYVPIERHTSTYEMYYLTQEYAQMLFKACQNTDRTFSSTRAQFALPQLQDAATNYITGKPLWMKESHSIETYSIEKALRNSSFDQRMISLTEGFYALQIQDDTRFLLSGYKVGMEHFILWQEFDVAGNQMREAYVVKLDAFRGITEEVMNSTNKQSALMLLSQKGIRFPNNR